MLALAAFILAQTTNAFVGQSLAVSASDIAAPRTTGRTSRGPRQNLSAAWAPILEKNVFKAKREDLKPVELKEPEEEESTPLSPDEYNEELPAFGAHRELGHHNGDAHSRRIGSGLSRQQRQRHRRAQGR
ncbi:MAG: hypothetical protein AAFV29_06400 [Myxococcota bacterium]